MRRLFFLHKRAYYLCIVPPELRDIQFILLCVTQQKVILTNSNITERGLNESKFLSRTNRH